VPEPCEGVPDNVPESAAVPELSTTIVPAAAPLSDDVPEPNPGTMRVPRVHRLTTRPRRSLESPRHSLLLTAMMCLNQKQPEWQQQVFHQIRTCLEMSDRMH
jgi:hypothetical protein